MAGRVYWITGLSGVGKTTIATVLVARMRGEGLAPILLDGDRLRAIIAPDAGYGTDARRQLAGTYGRLCAELSLQGAIVVCATISMFREVHEWNRANIPGYHEIYLRAPHLQLAERDPKGLYRATTSGEMKDMVGIDQQPEEPRSPDILIENDGSVSVESVVNRIWENLIEPDEELTGCMSKNRK